MVNFMADRRHLQFLRVLFQFPNYFAIMPKRMETVFRLTFSDFIQVSFKSGQS